MENGRDGRPVYGEHATPLAAFAPSPLEANHADGDTSVGAADDGRCFDSREWFAGFLGCYPSDSTTNGGPFQATAAHGVPMQLPFDSKPTPNDCQGATMRFVSVGYPW